MSLISLGIRCLLFALSTFGYLTFLHQYTKLKVEFLPAVTFTGQICLLFLAGLLNLLPFAVIGIFLAGLVLTILSWKERKNYRDFFSIGYILFIIACLYFLLLFKGQVFNSYDNFSHWALVVKQMLLTNRFPTWKDNIILFQSYPLGSSVFVYYVCRIISPVSEGCQMFAQTMLSLSMILPLFSYARKNKAGNAVLIIGLTLFLLSFNIRPTELLVDTLLPLTGAAGFLLLEEELSAEKKEVWLSIPFAIAVILIKNSGIFFWALMAAAVCIYWLRHRKTVVKSEIVSWISLLLLPLFALLLWKKHVEYVYNSGMSSIHSMSIHAYAQNIRDKSQEAIPQIVHAFFKEICSGRSLLYLLCILLLVAVFAYIQKHQMKPWIKTVFIIISVFAIYQAGNLCMYLFSMPEGEALVMAGYPRYYATIIIWCMVFGMSRILCWVDGQKHMVSWIFILIFFLCFRQMGGTLNILKKESPTQARAELERIMEEYPITLSAPCLVYIPSDDSGYTYHLTKYLFYTNTVDVHITSDRAELEEAVETAISLGYSYFINLDQDNPMIQEYCQDVFGVPAGTPFIQLQ